jgi:hypothetical protein
MRTVLTAPRVVSSHDFYVRVRAADDELPVNIDIECAAIDGVVGGFLSHEARWRIVENNLFALLAVAESNYIRGGVEEADGLGGRFRQVTLRIHDLRKTSFRLENAYA